MLTHFFISQITRGSWKNDHTEKRESWMVRNKIATEEHLFQSHRLTIEVKRSVQREINKYCGCA